MKIIIPAILTIAAVLAAPPASADTTLYGRLDNMLNYSDDDSKAYDSNGDRDSANDVDGDKVWGVNTRSTRIGVKGSEDLAEGMRAIYQAEWAFDSSSGGNYGAGLRNRLAYAGLDGNWGTAAIGRQWTPYYGSVDKTDIFNNDAYNAFYLGLFRTGNAILYETPDLSGFTASLMAVVDGADSAKDGIDAWNLSGDYNNGPASLGLSYYKAYEPGDIDDTHLFGIGGSWNFGMAKLIGQYETGKMNLSGLQSDDVDDWAVAGEFYVGNNTLRALYGGTEVNSIDANTWALSWQYNFSKRTRSYLEYGKPAGISGESGGGYSVGDSELLTLGFRHDF